MPTGSDGSLSFSHSTAMSSWMRFSGVGLLEKEALRLEGLLNSGVPLGKVVQAAGVVIWPVLGDRLWLCLDDPQRLDPVPNFGLCFGRPRNNRRGGQELAILGGDHGGGD
jgi:hypothetical protein